MQSLTEYSPQMEAENMWESSQESSVFGEADELAMAAEVLEITDEQSLDRFLGDLMKRAAGAAHNFFTTSPTGTALGGVLKGAAKSALPIIGTGIGRHFYGDTGARWGERAGNAASALLGQELEGLSAEDREFEVAKSFVRFAGDAVRNAVASKPSGSPLAAAQNAAARAAQRYAPGLLRNAAAPGQPAPSSNGAGRSGQWFRRGRSIVIVGV